MACFALRRRLMRICNTLCRSTHTVGSVLIKLPDQLDVMPVKRRGIHPQGIFNQFRHRQIS